MTPPPTGKTLFISETRSPLRVTPKEKKLWKKAKKLAKDSPNEVTSKMKKLFNKAKQTKLFQKLQRCHRQNQERRDLELRPKTQENDPGQSGEQQGQAMIDEQQ